jgi:hypothetical protein
MGEQIGFDSAVKGLRETSGSNPGAIRGDALETGTGRKLWESMAADEELDRSLGNDAEKSANETLNDELILGAAIRFGGSVNQIDLVLPDISDEEAIADLLKRRRNVDEALKSNQALDDVREKLS